VYSQEIFANSFLQLDGNLEFSHSYTWLSIEITKSLLYLSSSLHQPKSISKLCGSLKYLRTKRRFWLKVHLLFICLSPSNLTRNTNTNFMEYLLYMLYSLCTAFVTLVFFYNFEIKGNMCLKRQSLSTIFFFNISFCP